MIGGRRTGSLGSWPAAAAQLSEEDEAWIATTAQALCDGDEECDEAEEYTGALRDCLAAALGLDGQSRDAARSSCERYAGSLPNPNRFTPIGERVGAIVSAAVREVQEAGLEAALANELAESAGLCGCVTLALVTRETDPSDSVRTLCPSALAASDAAWVERDVAAFAASLTPLLDQGRPAADLLAAETAFRACLDPARLRVTGAGVERYSRADLVNLCRDDVTVSQGLIAVAGGAPASVSVSCAPLFVSTGEAATCTGSVVGLYTGLQWYASGGSPNTGTALTFATRYDSGGVKTVELTACNTVQQPGDRQLCTVGSAAVAVHASPLVITALSCTPTQVAVRGVAKCVAEVGGAVGAITRRWSAPGGDPADGRGPSFSTAYSQAGPKTITFRTCNGPDPRDGAGVEEVACAQEQRTITVTAPSATPTPTATAVTRCTRLALTGTWNTTTSNQGDVSFAFQQSGTTVGGSVTFPAAVARSGGFTSSTGTLQGTYIGDRLDVTLTFTTSRQPVSFRYVATIVQTVDATGQAGTGRLQNGNANGGAWTGSGPMRCAS